MPTRSRVRAKPAAEPVVEQLTEEPDFFPDEVTGTVINPQAQPLDEVDDGTISTEPVDGRAMPDPTPERDDPSAGNALSGTTAGMSQGQQAAQAEVRDYMRRMANLLEEREGIDSDIKELKQEFKGKGYDMTAMGLVVKLDRMDENKRKKRREQNSVNATYAHAAGIDEDLL